MPQPAVLSIMSLVATWSIALQLRLALFDRKSPHLAFAITASALRLRFRYLARSGGNRPASLFPHPCLHSRPLDRVWPTSNLFTIWHGRGETVQPRYSRTPAPTVDHSARRGPPASFHYLTITHSYSQHHSASNRPPPASRLHWLCNPPPSQPLPPAYHQSAAPRHAP